MKGTFGVRFIYSIGFAIINYSLWTLMPLSEDPNSTTFIALVLWGYEFSKGRFANDK